LAIPVLFSLVDGDKRDIVALSILDVIFLTPARLVGLIFFSPSLSHLYQFQD
jgi:hypothetical protein